MLFLFCSVAAFGHVPVFPDRDSSVDQPFALKRPYNKSIAIYTYIDSQHDLDVYAFELSEKDLENGPVEILIGTLVPACEPLKKLLLSWALVGPKQVALNDVLDARTQSIVNISDEQGALFETNAIQGEVWEEPYTAHYYFRQKRKKLRLYEAGKYRVYVWPSSGKKGDYVFEFGDDEIWPIKDILYTLWVYPKLLFEGEIVTEGCVTSDRK